MLIKIKNESHNPAFRADGALISCGFLEVLQADSSHARTLKRVVS